MSALARPLNKYFAPETHSFSLPHSFPFVLTNSGVEYQRIATAALKAHKLSPMPPTIWLFIWAKAKSVRRMGLFISLKYRVVAFTCTEKNGMVGRITCKHVCLNRSQSSTNELV